MAVRFHWLRVRAVAYPTEEPERVAAAVAFVAGLDASDDDIEATPMEAHHGGEVVWLETTVKRQPAIRALVAAFQAAAGDVLPATLDARTDEEGVLFVRFDKQEAAQGRLALSGGGDAIHVRIKPEVHPASREGSLAALRQALGDG